MFWGWQAGGRLCDVGLHKCSHALQSVMYFRGGLSVFKWRNNWIGVLERSSGR